AEKRVESLARKNQWKLKDVYSYLLHVAARNGKIGVAEFCKDKGANLDYEDQYGRTPLWLALRFNHVQMAESLRRWGASRGARAVLQWGYTYRGEEKNAVQLSMEVIFSNIKQDVEQGDRESAERKIEDLTQEKKLNHKELYGHLLCIAARHGKIGVAEFCKDKGADLDYEDYDGRTPLLIAIEHGQEKMAQALGEWGACKGTHEISGEPSTAIESPSCSSQGTQERDKKYVG
ncbi:ankyrin repeat domain-containing protein, partial [Wolbachia pipientis]|nr:ankyrin repeat domain-containing protein [Wolbachia pipientis]